VSVPDDDVLLAANATPLVNDRTFEMEVTIRHFAMHPCAIRQFIIPDPV